MRTKKVLSFLLAIVMLVTMLTSTASAYYEVNFTITQSNGVNKTVHFESLFSGQIIFYPSDIAESDKTYPVVSWANGTMCPPILYYGLLNKIAAGGYIVVANTELMAADGTEQIASIDYVLSENENEESIFYKKVDVENIGVIGHSQGGRSAVNAASADSRIDCVFSLAGSNFIEEAEKLSTPTFFVAGEYDFIVVPSQWIEPAYDVCKGTAVYSTLKRAIHTTCVFKPAAYSDYAIKWFDAWLKEDEQAKDIFKSDGELSIDSSWKDFSCKGF